MPTVKRLSSAALAIVAGAFLVLPDAAATETSPETPEYKCFVRLATPEGGERSTVIYFYELGRRPPRFSDEANIAAAMIPRSIRARMIEVHECARRELVFRSPKARELERSLPK